LLDDDGFKLLDIPASSLQHHASYTLLSAYCPGYDASYDEPVDLLRARAFHDQFSELCRQTGHLLAMLVVSMHLAEIPALSLVVVSYRTLKLRMKLLADV
jgi:hypothetical protein